MVTIKDYKDKPDLMRKLNDVIFQKCKFLNYGSMYTTMKSSGLKINISLRSLCAYSGDVLLSPDKLYTKEELKIIRDEIKEMNIKTIHIYTPEQETAVNRIMDLVNDFYKSGHDVSVEVVTALKEDTNNFILGFSKCLSNEIYSYAAFKTISEYQEVIKEYFIGNSEQSYLMYEALNLDDITNKKEILSFELLLKIDAILKNEEFKDQDVKRLFMMNVINVTEKSIFINEV